jgi:hypothetical protein
MAKKKTDKEYLELWQKFRDNIAKATPVDLSETPIERDKRVKKLEANPEAWFKYYFRNFYTSEPADFHIKASKRVLNNPEYYEVRSWSRELSKSGRTMFEVLYLALTGKKKNILLVSSSYDNAERLLLPYKSILEANNRIINDYGVQQSIGKWEAGEFTTKKGVAFRALGEGQNPRGTKKDEMRPDTILIDDIDTDEACRNKDRVKNKIKWVEEALIPTRSISSPLLIIGCGNIIAKYSCIGEMGKKADTHEIINIVDKNGNSSWPQKNKPENIARIRKQVSGNSFQKEYMNNPISEGDTFEVVTYGKCPKISTCEAVVTYADPSTSNKDKPKGKSSASSKSVVIVGIKAFRYYVYRVWVDQTNNSTFVDWIFEAERYLDFNQVEPKKIWIENNSLQDPFYTQVILPLIRQRSTEKNRADIPPIRADRRKKPEKFERVEGTLQPIDSMGNLIFNEEIKGTPHMQRMEDQMLAVSEDCKTMDGPDALEGGVWLLQNKKAKKGTSYASQARESRHY